MSSELYYWEQRGGAGHTLHVKNYPSSWIARVYYSITGEWRVELSVKNYQAGTFLIISDKLRELQNPIKYEVLP